MKNLRTSSRLLALFALGTIVCAIYWGRILALPGSHSPSADVPIYGPAQCEAILRELLIGSESSNSSSTVETISR